MKIKIVKFLLQPVPSSGHKKKLNRTRECKLYITTCSTEESINQTATTFCIVMFVVPLCGPVAIVTEDKGIKIAFENILWVMATIWGFQGKIYYDKKCHFQE